MNRVRLRTGRSVSRRTYEAVILSIIELRDAGAASSLWELRRACSLTHTITDPYVVRQLSDLGILIEGTREMDDEVRAIILAHIEDREGDLKFIDPIKGA